MKTLAKRIVAFVLMVCMLSAVMTPTALAVDIDEETKVETYYAKGTSESATNAEPGTYTDFKYLGATGTVKVNTSWVYAASFTTGKYLAMSFVAQTTGSFDVTVKDSGKQRGIAAVYFLPGTADYASLAGTLTTDSEYYIGTASSVDSGDTAMTETIPCVANTTYILLMVATAESSGNFRFEGMTMTPVEKVVNGTYYTVAEAIGNGVTDIQLTGDLTEDVTLLNGAKLDLNGYTLTGDVTAANGTIVDSASTKGGVKGKLNDMQSSNPAIALLDGDTYCFFGYSIVDFGNENPYANDDGSVGFWFGLNFTDAKAYEYVANGGLTVTATLEWSGTNNNGSATIGGMTDAIADWIETAPTEGVCGFCIKVTGLDGLDSGDVVTVTPSFTYAGGVTGSFDGAVTYTVA